MSSSNRFSLIKNALFSGLTASTSLLLLVLFMFAAQVLGVEALGVLSVGMAVGSAISFVLDCGINAIAIRRISAYPAERNLVAGQLLVWRTLIALGAALLFSVVVLTLIPAGEQRSAILIFGLGGIVRCINLSFRALLQAFNRFSTESILVLLDTLGLIGLGFVVLKLGGGPVDLGYVFLGVRLTMMLIYAGITWRLVPAIDLKPSFGGIWSMQKEAYPLGIAVMIAAVFWQIDILLLSALATAYATGIFSAAFRIIEGARVGPDSLANAFYPRLSFYQANDLERFDDLLLRGCKYVMIVGGGVTLMGYLFADEVIQFLYGEDYTESARVLALTAIIPFIFFPGQFLMIGLRALGLQTKITKSQALGLGSKLACGIVLIPFMGIQGAVIAAVVGSLILTASALYQVWRVRPACMAVVRWFVPVGMACLGAILLGHFLSSVPFLLALVVVGLVYLGLLAVLRLFDQDEIALIAQIARKVGAKRR